MLSKKRSRPIHVSGLDFRWLISPESHHVTLVVQHADINGQKLEVTIPSDIHRMWLEFQNGSQDLNLKIIKPALVEKTIREAIGLGWSPEKSSAGTFKAKLDETDRLHSA